MAIVIKKKVSLEFLGEDYKDAYLTFKSIPVIDLEAVQSKLKKSEKQKGAAVDTILDLLKEYFIDGQFPTNGGLESVAKEDLSGLDPPTCIECFRKFTGQELDPKAVMPSMNTSPMAETPQPSS